MAAAELLKLARDGSGTEAASGYTTPAVLFSRRDERDEVGVGVNHCK